MASTTRAGLDRALSRRGEDVTLRRRIGTSGNFVTLPVRAALRGYAPQELANGVVQGDLKFVISPSAILEAAAAWPGAAGGDVWPKVGDQLVARGRVRTIQAASTIFEAGEAVRIDAEARG